MRTNENKGLTTEELKKVVELLKKEENVEILEGLESLIHWMVVEKKLNIKQKRVARLFFLPSSLYRIKVLNRLFAVLRSPLFK